MLVRGKSFFATCKVASNPVPLSAMGKKQNWKLLTAQIPKGKRGEAANQLGISPGYLTEILSQQKTPGLGLALRIQAQYPDVRVDGWRP